MELQLTRDEFVAVLPATIFFITGIVHMVTDLFVGSPDDAEDLRSAKSHLVLIGCAGCALAFAALGLGTTLIGSSHGPLFSGALVEDGLGVFMAGIIIVTTFLATLASGGYLGSMRQNRGEYYALTYFGAGAMILLAQAGNLISLFVALETLSLCVYVLAGYFRQLRDGSEGALKYFVMGAFSSGFLVLGLAFIYGATGTISLSGLSSPDADPVLLGVGILLAVIGFAFKVGAVPFHSWVPDAYQGAPAIAAGWMAVTVKAAAFAALLRLLLATQGSISTLPRILASLSVVTMIVGNLAALNQTNIKRMLAYSGIAHSGYILIPVLLATVGTPSIEVGSKVLFYLTAYLFMTFGAFTAVAIVSRGDRDREEVAAFRGLAGRYPLIAFALTISLISLAGIPLTAGFIGKLLIFKDAVQTGHFLYLALIGILTSIVSLYYYLRPVVAMYFQSEEEPITRVEASWGLHLALTATTVCTLLIGILPDRIIQLTVDSFSHLAS